MKLLMENWRQFLNERETDQIYVDIIDFVIDSYTNPINYESKTSAEDITVDWEELANLFNIDKTDVSQAQEKNETKLKLVTHQLMFEEERIDDIYDQLITKVPEAKQIFESLQKFYDTFFALVIYLYYNEADGNPEAESYEEKHGNNLGGYFSTEGYDDLPTIGINFGSKRFKPSIGYKQFSELSKQDIFDLLKTNRGILRMILEHELTHMLNRTRLKGTPKGMMAKQYRKGRRRKKDTEYQKAYAYANSTEEIQARLIPIFSAVSRAIEGQKLDKSAVNDVAKLISLEATGTKDVSNIVKLLFRMYKLNHEKFLDNTTEKNKKRLAKRFYNFAQEIIK